MDTGNAWELHQRQQQAVHAEHRLRGRQPNHPGRLPATLAGRYYQQVWKERGGTIVSTKHTTLMCVTVLLGCMQF